MKNQYVLNQNKFISSKLEANRKIIVSYNFKHVYYETYICLGKYVVTRVRLSSAKFKDTLYGKTNCKYLNHRKKKLINYIQSMLIVNYFYNIYE